jgi:rod shape-determining protein MreC
MERLFYFIYQYRAFFTFLVLETAAVWLIVENNRYQGVVYFNTSSRVAASVLTASRNIRDYFGLDRTNRQLAEENALLRTQLEQRNQSLFQLDIREIRDPAVVNRYRFISGRVVNNSTHQFKNFITLDKGSLDGVEPGMAVINAGGVVGKVKAASAHFSVVMSLLNIDAMVSAKLKGKETFGTARWDGTNPTRVQLLYIPRHAQPKAGDSVLTTGYSAIYPEGLMIGIVSEVSLQEDGQFYDVLVTLSQDFSRLSYVQIVKSGLKAEQDSLEAVVADHTP